MSFLAERPGTKRALGVGVLAGLLALSRLASAGYTLDHVWAEDAWVFLSDAEMHGPTSLFYTYAGYLHTIPRVVTLLGLPLGVERFAAYAAISSVLILGTLAAYVYVAARRVSSPRAALIPALGMGLVPALRGESLVNLANLHWLFLIAALWAFLSPWDESTAGFRLSSIVVIVGASLSSVLPILILPIYWLRSKGDGKALIDIRGAALVTGICLQFIAMFVAPTSRLTFDRATNFQPRWIVDAVGGVFGPAAGPRWVAFVIGVVVALSLTCAWLTAKEARKRPLPVWGIGAVLYLLVIVVTGGVVPRYNAMAALFVVAGFTLLIPDLDRRTLAVAIICLAGVTLGGFPASQYRVTGPRWQSEIKLFRDVCASTGAKEVGVRATPDDGRLALLPCDA